MTNEDEINNLDTLVDVAVKKLVKEIEEGNTIELEVLLWHVPAVILAEYIKED
ncbi:hypothetical protein LCGC14_2947680 [marine sediment metagenome]|uniref:Uncharacterized protein n=1 Tax=marine sediment metagenome TaxID=412755 RepID=A0A0F9A7D2_9ZZZZ